MEKKNILKKLGLTHEEVPFNAEVAFFETSFGENSYIPIERRIERKQAEIISAIRKCYIRMEQDGSFTESRYSCLIKLSDDLRRHSDEVFKRFTESGFTVIDLSDELKDKINESGLYLISWNLKNKP
jgi:hypothetical protein